MISAAQLATLRQWLLDNGGHLHADVGLHCNDAAGVHCRALARLAANSCLCVVPHSLALSCLNARVDDDFTVFRDGDIAPQVIGYFYLMYQHLHREQSWWKPYLDTLPVDHHTTPFWFDEHDLLWLHDTDVLFTLQARQAQHRDHYRSGCSMVERAGIDVAPYTW